MMSCRWTARMAAALVLVAAFCPVAFAQSDQGKFRADTQDDISVIDRTAVIAHALKNHRIETEIRAESLYQFTTRPFGERDICDPINVIEDKTSRALEVQAALFRGGIIDQRANPIMFS